MYLAIDTSTEQASLALLRADGEVHSEMWWVSGRNHTAELYPALEHLLVQAKTTRQDLRGLAVAIGPGSFTGIRVGMAAAKGLAVALDIPLVGVGTLAAAAYAYSWAGRPVWAVVDAGRGDVAAACFRTLRGRWRRVREETVLSPDQLLAAVRGRAVFCGEIPLPVESLLRERLGRRALIMAGPDRPRRAGYLGRLGWERLARGEADDVVTLAPLYLRRPAVLEKGAESSL